MIEAAILDTDTLSAVMRNSPIARPRAEEYVRTHGQLTISHITRYEVLRGRYLSEPELCRASRERLRRESAKADFV